MEEVLLESGPVCVRCSTTVLAVSVKHLSVFCTEL